VSDAARAEAALVELIAEHGPALCRDHRRVEALLMEHLSARSRAVVVLHVATREGVAEELLRDTRPQVPAMVFERLVRRLDLQAGLTPSTAAWAVRAWGSALGRAVPEGSPRRAGPPVRRAVHPQPTVRGRGAPLELKGHRRAVTDLAFGPEGRVLLSVSMDRTLRLWDVATGALVRTFYGGHRDWVRSVAIHPDGGGAATGGAGGQLQLREVPGGVRGERIVAHRGAVRALAFDPAGRTLASGGADGRVKLWDPSAGDLRADLPIGGGLAGLAFDREGAWLACAGAAGAWLVDLDGTLLPICHGPSAVATGPGGRLVVGDAEGVRVHAVEEGRLGAPQATLDAGRIRAVAMHPNGHAIASADVDHVLRIWCRGRSTWAFETGREICALAFSGGPHLALGFVGGEINLCRLQPA